MDRDGAPVSWVGRCLLGVPRTPQSLWYLRRRGGGSRGDALELPPEAIVPPGLSRGGPAAQALAPAGSWLSLELWLWKQ